MSLQYFLSSIGAIKDRRTIRRSSFFGELHDPYAMNSSSNNIQAQALSMLYINVLLPPHCYIKNRRSHLDFKTPAHYTTTMGRRFIQGQGNQFPSLFDRSLPCFPRNGIASTKSKTDRSYRVVGTAIYGTNTPLPSLPTLPTS
jgi:hypothetical protein